MSRDWRKTLQGFEWLTADDMRKTGWPECLGCAWSCNKFLIIWVLTEVISWTRSGYICILYVYVYICIQAVLKVFAREAVHVNIYVYLWRYRLQFFQTTTCLNGTCFKCMYDTSKSLSSLSFKVMDLRVVPVEDDGCGAVNDLMTPSWWCLCRHIHTQTKRCSQTPKHSWIHTYTWKIYA